jgi:hypothetical protein
MAGSTNFISDIGSFIGTTNVWDVSELYSTDVNSDQFKELLVRLYQNVNNMALALNIKETGYYPLTEFMTGALYFPNPTLTPQTATTPVFRQEYSMTVLFGALPNAGSKSVVHNIQIDQGFTATKIYGAATNTSATKMIPLPYSSPTLNKNIELDINSTTVTITTGIDYSDFINTYITIKYLKS